DPGKRGSTAAALDAPDQASTAPQFANSTPNLPGHRLSSQGMNQSRQPSGTQTQQRQAQPQPSSQPQQQPQQQQPPSEQKDGFMQKMLKVLCCG
ncbi:hypothetical protein KC352_g27824, partial [Hortaea werneckii]